MGSPGCAVMKLVLLWFVVLVLFLLLLCYDEVGNPSPSWFVYLLVFDCCCGLWLFSSLVCLFIGVGFCCLLFIVACFCSFLVFDCLLLLVSWFVIVVCGVGVVSDVVCDEVGSPC
ncbi:unnamed protein product [Polarella glacialis]|uniref:Uncharacterized protein n=1 Tax=Polarella glacialis TaxID=89957 RepID=A0A813F7K7_POLGL|nr:unnamed protein product [Polarella glacialis]